MSMRPQIRELAWDILKSGGVMSAGEVADQMVANGYRPADAKDPNQLRRSVWLALDRDSRVTKVAPGRFAAR
jgi:hypothetical protein